jgi:hypothetical protein
MKGFARIERNENGHLFLRLFANFNHKLINQNVVSFFNQNSIIPSFLLRLPTYRKQSRSLVVRGKTIIRFGYQKLSHATTLLWILNLEEIHFSEMTVAN